MYQYGVQCSLEQLPERMPVVFRGTIAEVSKASSDAGYQAMELYIHDPQTLNPAELNAVAADHGLRFSGICTGLEFLYNQLCLTSNDSAVRQAAVDRLKLHLDLGAALDCPIVVGTMRGNIASWAERKICLDYLAEGLGQLDAHAQRAGAGLLVENILQYVSNYLNTLDEVGDFLRQINLPTVKLHIDTHSMHMEEVDPFDAIRRNGELIKYVHFSDSNRAYPGGGVIDFKSYYHALLDVGYDGYIVSECQPYPTAKACAERGLAYMKQMEQAANLERMIVKE